MSNLDDLPKLAERLCILNDYAQGLLAAVFNFKILFELDTSKPRIINDTNLSPIFKAIAKRFPDVGGLSQMQGYNFFSAQHKEIIDSLAEFYSILLNVVEFKEVSFICLSDCGRLVNLSPEWNVDIMEQFMRLLSNYVRLNLLMSLINDRKLVTAVYSRAFNIANGTNEPNYNRISQYLVNFESPIEYIQSELGNTISGRLGEVLLYLKSNFDSAFAKAESLRHEGLLNLIALPTNIKKPTLEDKRLTNIGRPNEIVEWLIFGYLICPNELAKPAAIESIKAVLSTGFILELYRGEPFLFHAEFDSMVSKSNSKQAKAALADATQTAVTTSNQLHFDRREFLRMQMFQMLALLKDKPALVAPKFPTVAAALGMARDEVLWYFRHVDQPSPTKKAKIKEDDYRDASVVELLYLVDEIKNHVIEYKHVIQKYYAEYLHEYYLKKLRTVCDSLPKDVDGTVRRHLESAVEMLSNLKINNPNGNSLEALRLNWYRLQVHLSLQATQVNAAMKDLIPLMNDIVARSRYCDMVEGYVAQQAGLHDLLYYRTQLVALSASTLKSATLSKNFAVFPSILTQFPNNISSFYPKESTPIGMKSVKMMETIFSDLSKRIAELVHETAVIHVQFARLGMTERTPMFIREARDARDGKTRPEKANAPPTFMETRPGTESTMRPDVAMKRFAQQKQILKNLLRTIEKYESITLYDTVFYPASFLRDAIGIRIRGFMMNTIKSSVPEEAAQGVVKRPSMVVVEIDAYLLALQTIESSLNINLQSLIRDCLLENIDLVRANKAAAEAAAAPVTTPKKPVPQGRAAAPSAPQPAGDKVPVIYSYAAWYAEMVLTRLATNYAWYSASRRAFISRPNQLFRVDKFTDLSELISLVELIGPNGVALLDQRLMRGVSNLALELKEIINQNRESLDELSKSWTNEQRSSDALRKIKLADTFADKSISLGNVLSFRNVLAEAVERVLNSKVPHIYGCIENAHAQYPANLFGVAGYSSIDQLANSAGIYQNVDLALRIAIAPHCREPATDKRAWSLLPYMYAAAVVSLANNEGTAYNPVLDAHDNNAGSLATTINRLIVTSMSLVCTAEDGGEMEMKICQREFVTVASTLLMRLHSAIPAQRPPQLDSVFLILYKFVQESKFLTFDEFDSSLPYAIVRTTFSDFHKRVQKKKSTKKADEDIAF